MSMLTQDLPSLPVVTEAMGGFGLDENYSGSSSYATPSNYAGPSDNAGPSSYVGQSNYAGPPSNAGTSAYNEEDDDPEGDSLLYNESSDSEPDEVEEEDQMPANHENDDESKDHLKASVQDFSVRHARREYRVVESNPKLWKAWQALKAAREQIYGTWESSVQKLPRPCIQGFRYCRNVISVDGTHLYTRYKHKLLVAVTLDANNQVLPLAFALVDEETLASWTWFLQMLARHFLPNEDDRVCLISDRHPGLINAINYVPAFKFPRGVHRFCLRHVCSNFNNKYKNVQLKDLCWRAGSESSARKFDRIMEEIKSLNPEAYDWLGNIDKTQWTLAHDGGWRTGILTTNMSEAVNGVLKGARRLPIVPLVENNIKSVSTIFLAAYSTCKSHGKSAFRYECFKFYSSIFSTRAYKKTYLGRFEPVYGEEYWDPVHFELVHNPTKRTRRGPGRDVTTRIRNEMDQPQRRARQQYQAHQT
ncbi:UNVERIFIED_CONTAM: hypothetical protein Sradi_2224400 [Sesamum radiatum]|uniref:MULE transposase domain-containing protein n=1 Tax=Sesamum radiatum TaxID=300843 RepID=A0AAW2T1J2_SESRA